MSEKHCIFACSVILLLVIPSLKSQQNFTKNEEKDDNFTIRYEIYADSTTNYSDEIKTMRHDLHKKLINNTQYDKMQYEFNTNNNRENNDSIQHKREKRSMQNHKDEKISLKSHTKNANKDSVKSNIVSNEMCHNDTCIRFCNSLGDCMVENKCIPEEIENIFPKVYTNESVWSKKRVNELFNLAIYDSCQDKNHTVLPEDYRYDYMIFDNGSIYLSFYKIFVKSTSYCFAIVEGDKVEVIVCSETYDEIKMITDNNAMIYNVRIIYVSFHIVSILFLLSVFLVYSILPELRNIHGFMLRNYSAALSVAYGVDIVNIIIKTNDIQYSVCVTIAFLNYFCFLAGFFWLIMISFDMWYTFRGFCSLQRNIKQRERRKLRYYVIIAWGCPFIFAIVSVIMDSEYIYVPQILRPQFQLGDCWFHEKNAFVLYYYGPKSVCIISSICLSIFTALKIVRYEKDASLCLTDSESKRYNDNKKWFRLYLKLFIVLFIMMGIKWSIMTVSWLTDNLSSYVSFAINLIDIIQNLCTFIIFVWKKKIKLMLMKRFGLLSQARCDTNVTSSTTMSEMPMQEEMSSYAQENYHAKSSSNGTEL